MLSKLFFVEHVVLQHLLLVGFIVLYLSLVDLFGDK